MNLVVCCFFKVKKAHYIAHLSSHFKSQLLNQVLQRNLHGELP